MSLTESSHGIQSIGKITLSRRTETLTTMFLFSLSGGNQLDDETTAFKIDKNTGVISTNSILDREQIPEFRLCVYASSVENPNITIIRNSDTKRQKREVNQEPSILIVIVKLEDINDNGPAFPTDPGRDHLVIGMMRVIVICNSLLPIANFSDYSNV